MRPGKGLGAVERLRGGVTGVGGIGRAAAGSDGHTQASMRNTHSRAISASWEKTRWDTIAKSPHIGGERGIVPDWRAIELPAGWRYTTRRHLLSASAYREGCKSPHKHLGAKQLPEDWSFDEVVYPLPQATPLSVRHPLGRFGSRPVDRLACDPASDGNPMQRNVPNPR